MLRSVTYCCFAFIVKRFSRFRAPLRGDFAAVWAIWLDYFGAFRPAQHIQLAPSQAVHNLGAYAVEPSWLDGA
jgi:hypothetical protein